MELFDGSLVRTRAEAPFAVRPLRSDDYEKGVISVLAQLTQIGASYSAALFERRFAEMQRANAVVGTYYVVVVEDTRSRRVVGTATLLVEQKFIRGAGLAGHVEDVVTDREVRGAKLGALLMETLLDIGRQVGCYKVMLDCEDKNIPFYEKFGMRPKERQMAIYFDRSKL